MPATVADARDLLIASVLCNDPVMYIDDRWLYEQTDDLPPVVELDLSSQIPRCLAVGSDITVVGSGYSTLLAMKAREELLASGISIEVIDLRILNPFNPQPVIDSVRKTKRLLVVDGGWKTSGFSAEVIASVSERLAPSEWSVSPKRLTLPDAPAPTSRVLEKAYYPQVTDVKDAVLRLMGKE